MWTNTTCADGEPARYHTSSSCALALDNVKPLARMTKLDTYTTTRVVNLSWTGDDGTGSGVASYDVRYNWTPAAGGTTTAWTDILTGTSRTSSTFKATPGRRYCFEVRAIDNVWNRGTWTGPQCTTTPYDDRNLTASSGWTRHSAAASYWGTYTSTNKTKETLTLNSNTASQIGVIASTCATCGNIAIYVGSEKVGTLSLYSKTTTAHRTLLLPRFLADKYGRIKLVTTASKNSSNNYALIDALLVTTE